MYDWNLRLSKRVDIWTLVICWGITIFNTIAAFIVYSTASAYDLYLPDQSAAEKALRAFIYLAPISIIATIMTLGDRNIAKKNARSQQLPSDFTPPVLDFKKLNYVRIISIAVILFFSLPWIFALVGIYISDIPGLNLIFLGRQPYNGLPSVHLGTHHGTWGFEFGVIAIILTKSLDSPYYLKDKRARSVIAGGIVFLAGYAIINGLEDGINEQILKRGIETPIYPILGWAYGSVYSWIILGVLSLLFMVLWYQFAKKKEKGFK